MIGRSNMSWQTEYEWPSTGARMLTYVYCIIRPAQSESMCRIFQLASYTFCLTIAIDCWASSPIAYVCAYFLQLSCSMRRHSRLIRSRHQTSFNSSRFGALSFKTMIKVNTTTSIWMRCKWNVFPAKWFDCWWMSVYHWTHATPFISIALNECAVKQGNVKSKKKKWN